MARRRCSFRSAASDFPTSCREVSPRSVRSPWLPGATVIRSASFLPTWASRWARSRCGSISNPYGCLSAQAAQRAIVAAKALAEMPERRGGDMRKQSGLTGHICRSREYIASIFKVGKNQVQQAKALLAESPDLADQVSSCAVSLADAYEQPPRAGSRCDRDSWGIWGVVAVTSSSASAAGPAL